MNIDFFTEKDFEHPYKTTDNILVAYTAARIANIKLKNNTKIVYGQPLASNLNLTNWSYIRTPESIYRAVLLDIQKLPIEKCEHSVSIVEARYVTTPEPFFTGYICQCGASVKPSGFEEVSK